MSLPRSLVDTLFAGLSQRLPLGVPSVSALVDPDPLQMLAVLGCAALWVLLSPSLKVASDLLASDVRRHWPSRKRRRGGKRN